MSKVRLAIIGNGMVGHRFIEDLLDKADAEQFDITVFCEEPRKAYDRVHLSSYFSHHTAEELSLVREGVYEKHGVKVLVGERAITINRQEKVIHSSAGRTVFYDKLIMATGSYPWIPPIKGSETQDCFVYRTIEDLNAIESYLRALQDRICTELEAEDGAAKFQVDDWKRTEGGGGRTCTLAEGAVFEKAGVAFSHVHGRQLPPSATQHRPELAGKAWQALGVSLVIHPRNPYVPTSHANVRFFIAGQGEENPVFWFGGGIDLTPYYGFVDDAVHWHRTARDALAPFGESLYPRFKHACDAYFFLKHRKESRGIGGVFFDDFNELGFERSFAVMRAVGDAYLPAYLPIVSRRKAASYGER